ncbi:MAG: GDP-mannose 4,6-dehydratase [Acidimicrobiia bacterium]|nr:GDP-mannose 4,6-dehydratase [Acidimicrobiia bacterium]MDH4366111.1 GDP-mannose 4,6-dehydratase [Acidimicrobiia bacterium]MDH5288727.1 GDP-mannose 4,6-dehydratase [Acidimicrobiia bacterium]
MQVVLTGCAGFIGSHLAERLVADGWRVTGVDAFTDYYDPALKRANLVPLAGEPRFELVEGNLVDLDLPGLLADRPAIIHLAAQAGVRSSFGQGFDRYVRDNVLASQRMLEAAQATGCRRVVYASSSSVYGDAAAYPCREAATARSPRSPYGVTKTMGEDLAAVYRAGGLETVGLRYFTVYGPRQRPDMAMTRLCRAVLGGPVFPVMGDGSQSRDFTFVDDAVDATVRALRSTRDLPPVLNVGGGQEATLRQVIDLVGSIAGRPVPLEWGPAQRGDVRRTGADTSLARAVLGWAPTTTLAEGLAAQFAWAAGTAEPSLPIRASA